MKTLLNKLPLATAVAIGLMSFGSSDAFAAATIINPAGTLALGVNDEGHLNTLAGSVAVNGGGGGATGLAYKFPDGSFHDATSPGCLCEGWGVSVNGTNSGYANVSTDSGANNLTVDSFTGVSGGTSATSSVHLTDLPGLSVVQAYEPAVNAPAELFRDVVTVTNGTGADVTDLKYVRVMDWDVPPTEFNEYVTIKGTTTTTLLEQSGDNGFYTANPLTAYTNAGYDPACDNAAGTGADCHHSGPNDHGAYFKFNFGSLAAGASRTFEIFYGAAATEALAIAAIGKEGIELYSLGLNNSTGTPGINDPTFIFGFKGVGGRPIEDNPVPEPFTLTLMGIGMAGLAATRRRRVMA